MQKTFEIGWRWVGQNPIDKTGWLKNALIFDVLSSMVKFWSIDATGLHKNESSVLLISYYYLSVYDTLLNDSPEGQELGVMGSYCFWRYIRCKE